MMPAARRRLLILALVLVGTAALPLAQAKKVLSVDDYPKWRSISGQSLSADGAWVAYTLQFTNTTEADTKPVLHLRNLASGQDVTVAHASGAQFSRDAKWVAYTVDPTAGGRGGRGGRAGGAPADAPTPATPPATTPAARGGAATPPAEPRRVELRNLATGAIRTWQDVASFEFANSSTHLLLRRRPAAAAAGAGRGGGEAGAGAGGGGAAAAPAEAAAPPPRGIDIVIHDLTTGKDLPLGSVGDSAFNRTGDLLAYSIDAAVKDSNGLFLFDLKDGRITSLDNDAKRYTRLVWNERGTGLAVLKGADVEKMRERPNQLLVYPDVRAGKVVVLDSTTAAGFPADWVISDRAALSWSDDAARVYLAIKPQIPVVTPPRRNPDTDADVDVWHTQDERIQSVQMIRATTDQNVTYRQAFDVARQAFVKLTDETMREIELAPTGKWAVGRETVTQDYAPASADFYRIDQTTGARTLMFKGQLTGSHVFGISPDGRRFLYWKDEKIQSYNLDTTAVVALGGPKAVSFTDMEFDRPGPKPPYGIAGFTPDGATAIVHHRFDLWALPVDGTTGRNLTNGEGSSKEIRFRVIRPDPLDPLTDYGPGGQAAEREKIDLSKPVTLSAYGEYTKQAGFYTLTNGRLAPVVYEDASFSNPARAANADTFLFTRQTFVEFPDLRVSGPNFGDSKKISDANPQQAEYLWGRRVLFDYKNKDGLRLQGILALPDDYKPGEKRPMIVTFYEKNSQNMHRYSAPSYLTGMGASPIEAVSRGYITMMPDIHFRTGSSHSDMLECVEAATRKVIELGYADPKRIGVSGHSYGGEGAAFIATQSKMFAAVGMGAGVTDLYSDFNQSWGWTYQVNSGSGANGHDYYLFGQGRWGFTPWDRPETYRYESAISHVKNVISPVLIMHGTADPTVSFTEGMNFYNALRFHDKNAMLLAYPGEGHGLRGLANRKDLTVRYFQFFDHFLKGAEAPAWIKEGVPFLKKGVK